CVMVPTGPPRPGPPPEDRAPGDLAPHRLRLHPPDGLPRAARRVLRDPGRRAGEQGGRRPVRGGARRHRHRPAYAAAEPARFRPGLRRGHRAHRDRRPGHRGVAAVCQEPATAHDVRAAMPHPVVGSAADPIALEPVDDVVVTTLVDNVYDALLTSDDSITRAPFAAGTAQAPQFEPGRTNVGLMAEHGFSALVTVRRGDTITSVLFDTGLSPDAMVTNADRLGLDLSRVHPVGLRLRPAVPPPRRPPHPPRAFPPGLAPGWEGPPRRPAGRGPAGRPRRRPPPGPLPPRGRPGRPRGGARTRVRAVVCPPVGVDPP